MPMTRVVIRMPAREKDALDRLRNRYFDLTKRRISRAAIVRVMVSTGLWGADEKAATEVLPEVHVARVTERTCAGAR